MKRHIAYLAYLIRHKYFVWIAGRALGVGRFRLLVHDWHKFLPSEWWPYASTFYEADGTRKTYYETEEFMQAWRLHQRRGSHHWQHWLLTWDRGETIPLRMPKECVLEMVADWCGAGRAITGKWEVAAWWKKNDAVIKLHPATRDEVRALVEWFDVELRSILK